MTDKKKRSLRNKVADAIFVSGMPLAKKASTVIREKEDQQILDEFAKGIAESFREATALIEQATTEYPALAPWLTEEKANLLPGRTLIRNDAIMSFNHYFDIKNMAPYFEKFAVNDDAYAASMVYFALISQTMKSMGYVDDETGEFSDTSPEGFEALTQLLHKDLATRLIKAVPGRWEFNNLIKQLSQYL